MQMYDKPRVSTEASLDEAVPVENVEELRNPHDVVRRIRETNHQLHDLAIYRDQLVSLYQEMMTGFEKDYNEMLRDDPANSNKTRSL